MRIRRCPEQINGEVFGPRPCLVMNPARHPRPDMASHTRHLSMRRLYPTVMRWRNRMAAGAECWMIGERDGDCAEHQSSGG
jgi:hypothetical protein